MAKTIEIFTYGSGTEEKVGCSSCPKSCDSRDKAMLTGEMLYKQVLAHVGEGAKVALYDYETGDKTAILERQNAIYKENGIKRMVNPVLIGPLSKKIWPAVIIDGVIKSEGTLLDLSQMTSYL